MVRSAEKHDAAAAVEHPLDVCFWPLLCCSQCLEQEISSCRLTDSRAMYVAYILAHKASQAVADEYDGAVVLRL
jgi:hypothetical protein